ncbi:hypothetical protein Hte_007030 [Hypoxylon texense]
MSYVYILSAKDVHASRAIVSGLATHLRQKIQDQCGIPMDGLAYTLAARRTRHPWVAAARARTARELADRLDEPAIKIAHIPKDCRVGFVFNGQGAQWYAMGRELITTYPVFACAITRADKIFTEYGASWSLNDELMRDEESTRLHEADLSQSATVALQLCLVDLLKSWGITPSAVAGHSTGEIAAAYSAGVLSFKEALGVVYFSGELAMKHGLASLGGGMLAAGVSPETASQYITHTPGQAVVACINSPESVTFSGDRKALDDIASRLEQGGLFARHLKVPIAYHSHHMLRIADDYTERLRSILLGEPKWDENIIYASPVTGAIVESPEMFTTHYWVRNITEPVLFSQSLSCMSSHVDFLLEIGPHSTLVGPIRQIIGGRKMPYGSCLVRDIDAVETMQNLACELLRHGYAVDLQAVNQPHKSETPIHVYDLPMYPWNNGGTADVKWYLQLDVTHHVPAALKDAMKIHLDSDETDFERLLSRVCFHLIHDSVIELENVSTEDWPHSHKLFLNWMKRTVALVKSGALGSLAWPDTSKGMKKLLADELSATNAAGRLVAQAGQNLSNILRGVVAPELLRGDRPDSCYMELPAFRSRALKQALGLMDLYAVKNPGSRVLEIGDGVAIRTILEGVSTGDQFSGPLLCHYTVAAGSTDSLEESKRKLKAWESIMDFQTLEIDCDPAQKPAMVHTYDLVVVMMALRTDNLHRALSNIRKLLNPGGRLLFVEPAQSLQMCFGTLAKPWLIEQPERSLEDWNDTLRTNGFDGVDFEISDCEEARHKSIVAIMASATTIPLYPYPISIIHDTAPQSWLKKCSQAIETLTGIKPDIATLEHAQTIDSICIFATEMNPFTTPEVKGILQKNMGALWLTADGIGTEGQSVARTREFLQGLRQEYPSKRYGHLVVEQTQGANLWTSDDVIKQTVHVWRQLFDYSLDYARADWEYAAKDSMLYVPRAYAEDRTETVASLSSAAARQRSPFRRPGAATSAPDDSPIDDAVIDGDVRFRTLHLAALQSAVLRSAAAAGSAPASARANPTEMLEQAVRGRDDDLDEAGRLVAKAVAARLADTLDIAIEGIDLGLPVSAHGVDSLIAVELRNWLAGTAHAKVSISDIVRCGSLLELGGMVVERSDCKLSA